VIVSGRNETCFIRLSIFIAIFALPGNLDFATAFITLQSIQAKRMRAS
jgi:hypothetical protein